MTVYRLKNSTYFSLQMQQKIKIGIISTLSFLSLRQLLSFNTLCSSRKKSEDRLRSFIVFFSIYNVESIITVITPKYCNQLGNGYNLKKKINQ